MKIHELQERRARGVADMRALVDNAETEKRDLTTEEDKNFSDLKGEVADLDKKIQRAVTLAEAERSAPAILHHGRGDGQYETRARDFSVTKAIRAAIGDVSVDVGFEREISAEVVRRSGRTFDGIAVPDEIFHAEKRTLTVAGDAANLYPTVHRPDLFIDRLRSAIVVGRLGATVLNGLVGTNDIPRQTASSTAQWVGEDGEITPTDAAFDDVTLQPRTVGAITSYSRRTMLNARPDIENLVRGDLAKVIAGAIDRAAMLGDGMSNTPTGIRHTVGVHQMALISPIPSWAEVLEFIAEIQSDDAEIGSMGWAVHPKAAALFRSIAIREDTNAGFLMATPNSMAGYQVAQTTALAIAASPPASTLLFGAWSQLLVGYWSGIDLLLNPYTDTAFNRGRVLVRAMRDCDVAVRHPESFGFSDQMPG